MGGVIATDFMPTGGKLLSVRPGPLRAAGGLAEGAVEEGTLLPPVGTTPLPSGEGGAEGATGAAGGGADGTEGGADPDGIGEAIGLLVTPGAGTDAGGTEGGGGAVEGGGADGTEGGADPDGIGEAIGLLITPGAGTDAGETEGATDAGGVDGGGLLAGPGGGTGAGGDGGGLPGTGAPAGGVKGAGNGAGTVAPGAGGGEPGVDSGPLSGREGVGVGGGPPLGTDVPGGGKGGEEDSRVGNGTAPPGGNGTPGAPRGDTVGGPSVPLTRCNCGSTTGVERGFCSSPSEMGVMSPSRILGGEPADAAGWPSPLGFGLSSRMNLLFIKTLPCVPGSGEVVGCSVSALIGVGALSFCGTFGSLFSFLITPVDGGGGGVRFSSGWPALTSPSFFLLGGELSGPGPEAAGGGAGGMLPAPEDPFKPEGTSPTEGELGGGIAGEGDPTPAGTAPDIGVGSSGPGAGGGGTGAPGTGGRGGLTSVEAGPGGSGAGEGVLDSIGGEPSGLPGGAGGVAGAIGLPSPEIPGGIEGDPVEPATEAGGTGGGGDVAVGTVPGETTGATGTPNFSIPLPSFPGRVEAPGGRGEMGAVGISVVFTLCLCGSPAGLGIGAEEPGAGNALNPSAGGAESDTGTEVTDGGGTIGAVLLGGGAAGVAVGAGGLTGVETADGITREGGAGGAGASAAIPAVNLIPS